MRNTLLILKREYLERVRTRSFMIMTLLIPALMVMLTAGPAVVMSKMMSKGSQHIVVVASTQEAADGLRLYLLSQAPGQDRDASFSTSNDSGNRNAQPLLGNLTVDSVTDDSPASREALTQKVIHRELDAVIWATDDALAAGKVDLIAGGSSSLISNSVLTRRFRQGASWLALKKAGIPDSTIAGILKPAELNEVNASGKGGPNSGVRFMAGYIMAFIMYFVMLIYGINVMRAVLEEKTSRIMEVMLSSARPSEMMAGKILGVGAVGLTQICIWLAASTLLSGAGIAASSLAGQGIDLKNILNPAAMVFFAVFFLLGYVLYSTLFAAVGSMVNSEQEAQQLQFFVTLPLIATVVILFGVTQQPQSPLAFWASIFPLTAPLIMFTRIMMQAPPWWQIALSIVLQLATIYGLILVCGRIYRIGILMYGKKPTLPEIMKWIRYA